MTTTIYALWFDANGHTWARISDGRRESTERVDNARTAQAATIRRAAEEWRAALPADPVRQAVERMRQLRNEASRRYELTREAAIAYANKGADDRTALDSALFDEENADELLTELREACELALPEAVREWTELLYEERRAARGRQPPEEIFALSDCANWATNTLGDCGGRVERRGSRVLCETCLNRPSKPESVR